MWKIDSSPIANSMFWLCLCVWVGKWVGVRVCVCMFELVHTGAFKSDGRRESYCQNFIRSRAQIHRNCLRQNIGRVINWQQVNGNSVNRDIFNGQTNDRHITSHQLNEMSHWFGADYLMSTIMFLCENLLNLWLAFSSFFFFFQFLLFFFCVKRFVFFALAVFQFLLSQ